MARAGLQHPKTNIPSCFTIFLGSIAMWKTPNDRPKYGTMVYNTLKLTKLPPKSGVHKTFAKVTHISICSLNLINPNWEYGIGFTRQMNMFPSTICRSCFEEETHGLPHLSFTWGYPILVQNPSKRLDWHHHKNQVVSFVALQKSVPRKFLI